MPKRKHPEEKPDEQFKRFVETVHELDVDESGKPLEEVFGEVAREHQKRPAKDRR